MKLSYRLIAVLCCGFFFTTQGCDLQQDRLISDASEEYQDNSDAKQIDRDTPKIEESSDTASNKGKKPSASDRYDAVDPDGGNEDDYRGSSQGSDRPARTGNPDEGPLAGPHGVCGNGVQEVLSNNPECFFDLYGTTTSGPDGNSYLIGFKLGNKGAGDNLGVISGGVHRVSAIDIAPDGRLYAAGENGSDESVLMTIDCNSAAASIIGLTNAPGQITDIDFDSLGRLFAYVEVPGGNNDEVGILNPLSGEYTSLLPGLSGVEDSGNGLASTPFPNNRLYHAGGNALSQIDKTTGAATAGPSLAFPAPLDDDPRINGMDADPFTNILYASALEGEGGSAHYLTTLNLITGEISHLKVSPVQAPNGLDGIAVNRRYEECDGPSLIEPLPEGTTCSEDCMLMEMLCYDALDSEGSMPIDNDGDGLANCDDPDCYNKPCNDRDGCTLDDACVPVEDERLILDDTELECRGTPVDCDEVVGKECAMTSCVSISEDMGNGNFKCNSMLDTGKENYGSCTPDENCGSRNPDGSCESVLDECVVGRCVELFDNFGTREYNVPQFICEGEDKVKIHFEDGGCKDDETCTADMCKDGICMYSQLDGTQCDDGNQCTNMDRCNMGVCEGMDVPNSCNFDVDCAKGSVCVGGGGTCVFTSNGPIDCVNNQACPSNTCSGQTPGICTNIPLPCFSDVDCPQPETCLSPSPGTCLFGASPCFSPTDCPPNLCALSDGVCSCNDANACTDPDSCVDGSCGGTNISGPCDDGNDCTDSDTCNGGVCSGDPVTSGGSCEDGNFCTVMDQCDGMGQCISGTPSDFLCFNDPFNSCVESVCTEVGCKNTLMDGLTPCIAQVAMECFQGSYQCVMGVPQGECIPVDPPQMISCPPIY